MNHPVENKDDICSIKNEMQCKESTSTDDLAAVSTPSPKKRPPNNSVGTSAVSLLTNSQLPQDIQDRVDVRQNGGAGTQNGDKDYEEIKKEMKEIRNIIERQTKILERQTKILERQTKIIERQTKRTRCNEFLIKSVMHEFFVNRKKNNSSSSGCRSPSRSPRSPRRSPSRSKVSRSPSLTRSRKRSRVESSSGSKENLDSRSCLTLKSRQSKVSRNDKKFNRIETCSRISTFDPKNDNLESRPDSNRVKNLSAKPEANILEAEPKLSPKSPDAPGTSCAHSRSMMRKKK